MELWLLGLTVVAAGLLAALGGHLWWADWHYRQAVRRRILAAPVVVLRRWAPVKVDAAA
jgi:hypothetical protein